MIMRGYDNGRLFVDDLPNILQTLETSLKSQAGIRDVKGTHHAVKIKLEDVHGDQTDVDVLPAMDLDVQGQVSLSIIMYF